MTESNPPAERKFPTDIPMLIPANNPVDNMFNIGEISDFIIENKGELCVIILEHLFERLKSEGLEESDMVRGMAKYCEARNYPQELIDNLQNSANALWTLAKRAATKDATQPTENDEAKC